jgi:hypothetical protein
MNKFFKIKEFVPWPATSKKVPLPENGRVDFSIISAIKLDYPAGLNDGGITLPITKEFKRCPSCGYEWKTRERFMKDPALRIIGYQVSFVYLEEGIFLFNHRCGTSLGVIAGAFRDLYDGPIFSERLTGTDECPQYCLLRDELRPCPAKCECAYVRETIQIIKDWPKRSQK